MTNKESKGIPASVESALVKGLNHVGFETLSMNASAAQARITGRVDTPRMAHWQAAMLAILRAWPSSDISRQYFERDGQIVFHWRIIVQGDIAQALTNLAALLPRITPAQPRASGLAVSEKKTTGHMDPTQNNGKGVSRAGSAPLILQQRGGR